MYHTPNMVVFARMVYTVDKLIRHKQLRLPKNMAIDSRTFALIKQRLDEAERNIQFVRQTLDDNKEGESGGIELPEATDVLEGERIVEGVFNGQNMIGNDGEEYPVPPNYASKSKLVEGDVLKLTIGTDGSFLYKQISPVERRRVVGTLVVDEDGAFGVKTPEKTFKLLLASVTFYRAQEGDEITILLPVNGDAEWGAVENVIHR